jgi:hypothetical protein
VDVGRRSCTGKELRDFAGDPSGSPFEHFVCFDSTYLAPGMCSAR